MILINGQPDSKINVSDRGLQYGDGLFETMAFKQGKLHLLELHLERLAKGCKHLDISLDMSVLMTELSLMCSQLKQDCVIKLIVTRGEGGRGYKASKELVPTRIITSHDLPDYPIENQSGIKVCLCQTKLGINPALAGLKHLNRLEQVLARNEWDDSTIKEGLMFDNSGHLIEGTMSNLFIVKAGHLYTPSLNNSGIAGVMRQRLMQLAEQLHIKVFVKPLEINDLAEADEVFVCNSLIGIWPVITVVDTEHSYLHGNITKQLQYTLAQT